MTIQRIIELLEIEHECILRNSHDDCDRNCADCDLVQDDGDLHEMYTDVIALLKEQEEKMKHLNNITLEYEKEVFRLQTLLKEQEAVEPNEWIKCSDEMPEEQETIFAKFKGTDKWGPAMFARSSEDVRVVIVFADGTRRVSHSHTIDGK